MTTVPFWQTFDQPSLLVAIAAYETPPEPIEAAFFAAQSRASPIVRSVEIVDLLAPHAAVLDRDGARVLAGCALYVLAVGYHGKTEAAVAARDAALARLTQLG